MNQLSQSQHRLPLSRADIQYLIIVLTIGAFVFSPIARAAYDGFLDQWRHPARIMSNWVFYSLESFAAVIAFCLIVIAVDWLRERGLLDRIVNTILAVAGILIQAIFWAVVEVLFD